MILGLAYELLDKYTRNYIGQAGNLQDEVSTLQEENYRLRKREELTRNTLADSTVNESQLKATLQHAYQENVSSWLTVQWSLNYSDLTYPDTCLGTNPHSSTESDSLIRK